MATSNGAWVWSGVPEDGGQTVWQCRVLWRLYDVDGDTSRIDGSLYIHRLDGDSYPYIRFRKGVSWYCGSVARGTTTVDSPQIRPNGTYLLKSNFTADYVKGYEPATRSFNCGVTLAAGDFTGNRTGTVTVTLVVPAKDSYGVYYNANGGSGEPSGQTKWYDETLYLSSTRPTRTGYDFVCWNTDPNGGGASYNPGSAYMTNAGCTLYAIWREKTYTVSYNYGTQYTSFSNLPSAQTKYYWSNLTLTSNKPSQVGYDFVRWNTKIDGSGTNYSSGGTYSTNAAVTLYAQWTIKIFNITYNGNVPSGASGLGNMPSNQTKTYNVNTTLSSKSPTLPCYTFLGWSTSSNGEVSYQPGDLYITESNVTLYAIWKPDEYTITYNGDGAQSNVPASQIKKHGISLTLSSLIPSKNYHTFTRWKDNATSTYYEAGSSFTTNANSTLTAQYNINKVTIHYKETDASTVATDQVIYYLNGQGQLNKIQMLKPSDISFTKTGYHIVSGKEWNTLSSGNGTTYSAQVQYNWVDFGSPINENNELTLYPKWATNDYKIRFNKNAGKATGTMSDQAMVYNQAKNLTKNIFQRTGYTFIGWNTQANGNGVSYADGVSVSNLTTVHNGIVKLYAQWRLIIDPPTIEVILSQRTDNSGVPLDDGENAKIQLTNIKKGEYYNESAKQTAYFSPIQWEGLIRQRSDNTVVFSWSRRNITYEENIPTISTSDVTISKDDEYEVVVTIYSTHDGRSFEYTGIDFISKAFFIIDVNKKGTSIAFGRSAPDEADGTYYFNYGVELYADGNIKIALDTSQTASTIDRALVKAFTALGWNDIYN